ncbi:Cwf15/Cwc15 cell cycle control protein [Sistotremastrum niveocremeum HHB9708]|uniref:Cwf15/Cwc15 cell cycle control protein n=2 Tax=Sistotremastraceae TaxID=3402574 RepID=A0A164NZF4_9AGAM|nr:Cwf15/Cwc15 cell cycle control protein [Sistotremastrum niveocremeum HHB9708]KZT36525.1 Cwf15/Cwc15 cell cycle control protein [Sistotremastrum suecicum HHB10207 ss-3]
MSTAHRPTWDPAQAKEVKGGSRQFSARDMAAQTKLKFRQPGQSSTGEVARLDLRQELLAAEAEAKEKKRKAQGLPPSADSTSLSIENGASEESNKRRKLLQEALELDRDDDDDDDKSDADAEVEDKTNGKAGSDEDGEEKENEEKEDEDDDDDDDDEDDTAELLRELEKIKRERAEEKARQDRENAEKSQQEREEEIASGNPLLNLAAALGQSTGPVGTGTASTFAVKRRWDDDLIFKNQAQGTSDKPKGQFVNDLLRTEFHRKFMAKFIK